MDTFQNEKILNLDEHNVHFYSFSKYVCNAYHEKFKVSGNNSEKESQNPLII